MHPSVTALLALLMLNAWPARADGVIPVSVRTAVEVTCELRVSVPKVGSPERTHGGGGAFAMTCGHSASVAVSPGGAPAHAATAASTAAPSLSAIQAETYEMSADAASPLSSEVRPGPRSRMAVSRGLSLRGKLEDSLPHDHLARAVVAEVAF